MKPRHLLRKSLILALTAIPTAWTGPAALASNHSDAPLIKQDPQANLTDVYAFIGTRYDNPSIKVLNVSMSFRPFSEPGDGAQYERFAERRPLQHPHHESEDRRDPSALRLRIQPGERELQEPQHDPFLWPGS